MGNIDEGLAAQNKQAGRRLPYNTDLLMSGLSKLAVDTEESRKDLLRVRAAALLGFMFLWRGSELEVLELRGVTASSSGGAEYVRVFFRKSKTYQEER